MPLLSQPQPPASATPAPGPASATPAPPALPSPISSEQADFLRVRREALGSQLESAQDRRNEIVEELRNDEISATERAGLESRLRVLDERLLQIEKDIASNGQQLALAPPRTEDLTSNQVPAPDRSPAGFAARMNPNAFMVLSFMLLVPIVVLWSRRLLAPDRGPRQDPAELAQVRARLDKMELALESVAVEVERVGEGQRFLTQAMRQEAPMRAAADPVALPAGLPGVGAPQREAARAELPRD